MGDACTDLAALSARAARISQAEGFSEGDFGSVDDGDRGLGTKEAPAAPGGSMGPGAARGAWQCFPIPDALSGAREPARARPEIPPRGPGRAPGAECQRHGSGFDSLRKVIQHGFLSEETAAPTWHPRGTLLLSGAPGSVEARLSDAKEFVELRPELQGMMVKESEKGSYYAIRMYRDQNPSRVLLASVPAKLLADHFEDWHDILRVSVGPQGLPVALSYRVRHTLGLSLFDHTQVHLSESTVAEGPRVPPRVQSKDGLGGGEAPAIPSIIRKYWWVIMIAVLLTMSGGGDDGRGGGSGGGSGAAPRRPAARS
ncbi:unnamed protein product [Prorocentrum cordatum]|uniref:ER membrane protein complex subunit 10 n=1 Tax=Prorocentrum cordatum TaxID=2364126 RepID=A0ABN9YEU4_9DINO|nr:unnamed protein product [Polarella glacialis]